jgi:hypothetical protein
MTLMLLASVLPFSLPLLNLCTRDRNYLCRESFESFKRCFLFCRLGLWHGSILFHRNSNAIFKIGRDLAPERNAIQPKPTITRR